MSSKPLSTPDDPLPSPELVPRPPRPPGAGLSHLALALELFLGVGGLYGGISLTRDPTGGGLGMGLSWLAGTPFPDYRIPGVILVLANGLLPMVAAAAIVIRRSSASGLVIWSGLVLCGWIGVQIALIGYVFWLQGAMLALGLALVLIGYAWRQVQRSYGLAA